MGKLRENEWYIITDKFNNNLITFNREDSMVAYDIEMLSFRLQQGSDIIEHIGYKNKRDLRSQLSRLKQAYHNEADRIKVARVRVDNDIVKLEGFESI